MSDREKDFDGAAPLARDFQKSRDNEQPQREVPEQIRKDYPGPPTLRPDGSLSRPAREKDTAVLEYMDVLRNKGRHRTTDDKERKPVQRIRHEFTRAKDDGLER